MEQSNEVEIELQQTNGIGNFVLMEFQRNELELGNETKEKAARHQNSKIYSRGAMKPLINPAC